MPPTCSDHNRFAASLSKFVVESKSSSSVNTYFWNEKFQEIMDMDEGQIKYQKLRNLAHDFTHAASVYVAARASASSASDDRLVDRRKKTDTDASSSASASCR